jgi:glutamate dehydrogenase
VHPDGVRVLDDDDTYLVVAADKGTATVLRHREPRQRGHGFWLGDAFASGGSTGYDHKALGITARGAWESVKRHFSELEVDVAKDPFHGRRDRRHVGRRVRERDAALGADPAGRSLRHTGTSSSTRIPTRRSGSPSASGSSSCPARAGTTTTAPRSPRAAGCGQRSASRSRSRPQVRACAGHRGRAARADRGDPRDPPRARRPALERRHRHGRQGLDESDADAQDRASRRDPRRRARAALPGRGGGRQPRLTRRARVEFSREGGRVNADFIDNSAGVDCSDHEVNLKILLGLAERAAS